jgi:hypothetical protein
VKEKGVCEMSLNECPIEESERKGVDEMSLNEC